jgi:hypothetical protein
MVKNSGLSTIEDRIMAKREQGIHSIPSPQNKGVESNPRALRLPFSSFTNSGLRLRDWWMARQPLLRTWLTWRVGLAATVLLALNAADAYVTNYGQRMASAAGVSGTIEKNPFLQPFVGTWLLMLKGLVILALVLGVAWWIKAGPSKLFLYLVFGCFVFTGIIGWNLYSLGVT